jgi:ribosome biogenesis GTPase A
MNEKENVTLEELKKLEETSEQMARNIRMISRSIKKLLNSGLKKETIVILIHAYSNVGKTDIRAVFAALENLEKESITEE